MSDDMFYCSFVSIHYIICECGETFPSEEDLKAHLELEHAHRKERKDYKCGICDALFNSEEACIKHFENAHIEIKTEHDYTDHDYGEHDYVDIYEEEDVKPPIDIKDDKIIVQSQSFVDQDQKFILKSQNVVDQDQKFVLEVQNVVDQDQKFISQNFVNLEQKLRVQSLPLVDNDVEIVQSLPSANKPKKKKSRPYSKNRNIVCEVCGKRYASNAALKYHQRVHTGEKPYKCALCPKSFTMPLFLQVHIRTHTGERPYACPLCPKAFSNKAALLRHDRVHTGVKPYGCPRCGKFFTQSNSMKLHVKTVHLKMPAPYKSKNRKNKAKEKNLVKEAMAKIADSENNIAVKSIKATGSDRAPEVTYMKPELDLYEQEVEESEIMLEDGEEITYEVIYE